VFELACFIAFHVERVYGALDGVLIYGLDERNRELLAERERAEGLSRALDSRNRELETLHAELAKLSRELDVRNRELADRSRELDSRNRELADRSRELDSRNRELADRSRELEAERERTRALETSVEHRRREIDRLCDDLRQHQVSIESQARALKAVQAELHAVYTDSAPNLQQLSAFALQ
jgi:chromosome segregation ATPase